MGDLLWGRQFLESQLKANYFLGSFEVWCKNYLLIMLHAWCYNALGPYAERCGVFFYPGKALQHRPIEESESVHHPKKQNVCHLLSTCWKMQ